MKKSILIFIFTVTISTLTQANEPLQTIVNAAKDNAAMAEYQEPNIPPQIVDNNFLEQLKTRAEDQKLIELVKQAGQAAKTNASQFQSSLINLQDSTRDTQPKKPSRKGRLYLFISESVPLNTLREYARVLEQTNVGVMVINGFVDGIKKVKPTMTFLHAILKQDAACNELNCAVRHVEIDVNPILFSKYGINRVPAFVWDANPPESFCDADKKPLNDNKKLVIQGAADVFYVLEIIANKTQSEELNALLKEHYQL